MLMDVKNLTEITLPSTLQSIGSSAFYQCSLLEYVLFTGKGTDIFTACYKLEQIYVYDYYTMETFAGIKVSKIGAPITPSGETGSMPTKPNEGDNGPNSQKGNEGKLSSGAIAGICIAIIIIIIAFIFIIVYFFIFKKKNQHNDSQISQSLSEVL